MIRTLAAALATTTCIVALAAPVAAQTREFNVPAGSLRTALDTFARQSGRQVIYRDDVKSARSPGVRGARTAEEALNAILAGTGFVSRTDRSGALAIVKAGNAPIAPDNVASSGDDTRVADSEEIIVTGTNIAGGRAVGAPIVTRDREQIEAAGISSTPQLLRTLPQNFGGGVSDQVSTAFFGGAGDAAAASSPNLRGLGSEATLTLLNGRRTTGAGLGDSVDVSIFPISGLDRVDVLLDGASALYGSDAVGGVVNVILRSDFDGAESRVRYGSVTEGSYDELVASQVLGKQWTTGGVTASYTYRDQSRLEAGDRSFTSGADPAYTLLPAVRVHSGTLTARQDVGADTRIDFQGLYSDRRTQQVYSVLGFAQSTGTKSTQLHLAAGVNHRITSDWSLDAYGSYSRSGFRSSTDADDLNLARSNGHLDTLVGEVKLSGSPFSVPGGPVRLAVGGQVRREGLNFTTYAGQDQTQRTVMAAFGEVQLPLVAEANRMPGIEDLHLSLAGRYEHYSDFGSSFDPRVGLEWTPVDGLRLRGTWGTSFRAPRLYELNPVANAPYGEARPIPDQSSPNGTTNVVVIYGSQPNLRPETSHNWTAGIDWHNGGFKASATYFNIDFKNQVGVPISDVSRVLLDAPLYSRFLNTSPSPADVASYFAFPLFFNDSGLAPSDIHAVIDDRIANTAENHTSGIDGSISYDREVLGGRLTLQADATYLLDRKIRFVEGGPSTTGLNDAYLPVDFKARAGASLASHALTVSAFANYVDGYSARFRDGERHKVGSWTTFDLNLQFDLSRAAGGLSVNLTALNILDKKPPRVESPYAVVPIDFDATNASPIGRFLAIEVVKRW